MRSPRIRRATRADSSSLIRLLEALAEYEHLRPPTEEGKRRLVRDIFERRKLHVFVASVGPTLVGYALYFYTYASFLARPTLYLEDLFVLKDWRGGGTGFSLFRRCVDEAINQGCGRMEWAVLTWNKSAIGFYEKLGAARMSDWFVYRLDEAALRKIPRKLKSVDRGQGRLQQRLGKSTAQG